MMLWFYIGLFLLVWVGYDLFTGAVWAHRRISRSADPLLYWFWLGIYFLLALWCILPYFF